MKPAAARRSPATAAAVALLCGIAACSQQADAPQGAAAPASAGKPDYMNGHVARDAALSEALIGAWSETFTEDGAPLTQIVRYAADRTLSVAVTRADKPGERYSGTGTWSIAQGFLTVRVTGKGSDRTIDTSEEILRIDKGQLVYIDGTDKKTKIATRVAPEALAAAVTAAPPQAPPVAATPAPAPAPVVEAATPGSAPFFDDTIFIAKDDVQTHVFRLSEAAQFRLSVEFEERVPVNVITQRGSIGPEQYTMNLGLLAFGQVLAMADGSSEKTETVDDLFRNRLSKRAAYGRFESPWVRLNAGTYTVILDNSGELSPSRGDAPARLRLYVRPPA